MAVIQSRVLDAVAAAAGIRDELIKVGFPPELSTHFASWHLQQMLALLYQAVAE
jgi:hypothetical protein